MSAKEVPLLDSVLPAWQRREMVVSLLHADCERCAQVRERLEKREGILGDPEVFVLLLDATAPGDDQRRLREAAGVDEDQALIVLGNRFLELYKVLDAHSESVDGLLK